MLRRILLIIFSLGWMSGISQSVEKTTPFRYGYLQMVYHTGTTWSRTEYLSEAFKSGFRGADLRIGFQATGKRTWELFHNYPRYGLGVSYSDLIISREDTTMGNPFSGFAFFSAPWARWGRTTLYSEISLGLSYTSLVYDPVLNPYNDVVASHLNLYFNFSLNLGFILNKRIDLYAGGGLTHYSNGAIHRPQKGVNNWGANLGLSYHFRFPGKGSEKRDHADKTDVRPNLTYFEIEDTTPRHELQIMTAAGIKEKQKLGEVDGSHYFTSSITADYVIPISLKNRITFGLDFLYDGSLERAITGVPPEDVTTLQKTYLGSHMGYHILIDRFTLLFNFGTYMVQHSYDRGFWFMRAGGRVRMTDWLHAHICIKTKAGIRADWIEWGLVYCIRTN